MNLSVNPESFLPCRSSENARTEAEIFKLIKNAGFNLVDYSGTATEDIYKSAELLSSMGLKVNQSHSPYNRYKKEDYSVFEKKLMTGIKNAAVLGSNIYVVHGDEFDFKNLTYSRSAVLEFNRRLFTPIVDFGAANNIKIAFETVFEEPSANPRFCSLTEDLIELTDSFDSKYTGICWDFGHAKVQYPVEHPEKLRMAGSRVIATHVHDNHHNMDMHLMPFFGNCDWESCMKALRSIGYTGDLTFELVYDTLPLSLLPCQLELLRRSGEYLLKL